MKQLLTLFLLMCVSLSAMASETSVKNAEGVEIWYDFDSSTKKASVTYKGGSYDSYDGEYSGDVVIPSTVTYEGVEYSVTRIGSSAFEECSGLTSVMIPEGVTKIGSSAFYGCSSLTSIDVASDNNNYTSIDGVLFSKDKTNLIKYPEGKDVTSYALPEGVTSIGNYAFEHCEALTSITLPEGVTSIGKHAFRSCTALTSITLPEGLTSIEDYAFEHCEALTSITLPEGVTSIGKYAFEYCSSLTSITIPEGVTSIGTGAFEYCEALTSITLPEGVTSIGDYAFEHCEALTSITLPKGVTSIGKYAFEYCKALTSITLPEGLTSIGTGTFEYCEALTSITLPEGVTSIGNFAFEHCEALTSITLPESLTSIGKYAFFVCTALTSITLPESLTSIGDYAFYYCDALTSITLPEGVTSIGDYAFYHCSALISITLPDSLTSIGDYAFEYCEALTSITLPEGVTSIGDYTFYVCSGLTSITLPESLTSIGDYAFYKCEALTSITLSESLMSIGRGAFMYCSALTSITLSESVTSIGNDAFYYCDALTSITSKNTTPPTIGGSDTFDDVDKSIPVYVPKSSVDAYKSAKYWKDFTNFIGGAYFVDVTAENGTVKGAGAYEENAEAKLTVTPAEGYKFVKWSDGVTDNPRTVVVTSDMTFTADIQKCWTVNVTAENGDILDVGVYLEGDEVTITATPNEGCKFVKWSDGVTDNPRTVVVVSDTTFTAVFEIKEYTLTTEAENGTVEGAGTYKHGDEVTLTATPIVGYIFAKWSDGVTDNPRTVVVVSDTTLTAEFEIDNTPISDIQTSDVKVRLIGNRVVVEGADDYTVYSISGQNLGKVESVEKGVYIVVVNGKSYKVVAK